MFRAPMGKVNNLQGQMDNVSKEMDTRRNDQKEVLEIRNTIKEMQDAFGDTSRLDMAKERTSKFKHLFKF